MVLLYNIKVCVTLGEGGGGHTLNMFSTPFSDDLPQTKVNLCALRLQLRLK
jgi:hypothetical protein